MARTTRSTRALRTTPADPVRTTTARRRRRTALAATAALTGALLLAGCADGTPGDGTPGDGPAATADAATANDADVMFAQMMIPHHEQALTMAEAVLQADGVSPDVVRLATAIQDAQGPEILQLTALLERWGAPTAAPDGGHAGHGGMAGMLDDDEIAALQAADGAEAERLFLESMIVHHEGALTMAQEHLDTGTSPDALAISEAVVTTQAEEIATMRALLG